MFLVFCVILAGLVFEYINGFHDTANAIATVVSTRVLTPRQAIIMAAGCNLIGALCGTAVAATIGAGLVDTGVITQHTVLCALAAAIIWNIWTWWLGLPSSSSHALIGGLCGAALAAAHGDFSIIKWNILETGIDKAGQETVKHVGLWPKVVMPMIVSPICGLIIGFLIMGLLLLLLRNWKPFRVSLVFGKMQLLSAGLMGFSHGSNDAQKTMGIITLALFTATKDGLFDKLPSWLNFLHTPEATLVHDWVIIACALTMAAGTAAGGWKIIKTLGHRMVKLQPIHGFAAETSAAAVIFFASHLGIPLSTTHVISCSIMGVGATRRFNAVKWSLVGQMVVAWGLTIPATALLGFGLDYLTQWFR